LVDLQKSGNDSQTSKAGDANFGGGTGGDGSRDTGGGNDGHLSGRDHGNGGSRDGRVGVAAGAGVADDRAGGDDGLGDGARAVGDGDGGGLSNSDGAGAVGDGGGGRAVGDVGLDNLSDDGHVARVSHSASGGGEDSSSGELHFDGIKR